MKFNKMGAPVNCYTYRIGLLLERHKNQNIQNKNYYKYVQFH